MTPDPAETPFAKTPFSWLLLFSELSGAYKEGVAAVLPEGVLEPNPKMGAPDPENPLFLGFSVLRGGLRPWFQTHHGLGRGQTMGQG